MNNKLFCSLILERGKSYRLQEMEIYIEESQTISIKVFNSMLDKYTVSSEQVLTLRGIYNNRIGYSYIERLDSELIDMLVMNTIESAKNNDSDDCENISPGSCNYDSIEAFDNTLSDIKAETKIQLAMDMEKEAFLLDERVQAVDYCSYEEETKHKFIKNSRGLELENSCNTATAFLSVVVREGNDLKTGSSSHTSSHFSDFSAKKLSAEAVGDAISMLKASSISSGDYEIILRNNVAATMLEGFAPVFCADRIQKNMSLLKNMLGAEVASSRISLIDDPLMINGARSKAFDDEATPSKRKYIIRNGRLEMYLYNNKTALKDSAASTGNGIRTSHKSGIGIAPTNMYFAPGESSLEDMIASIRKGIMIIDIQGTHAGINALSGDFSLSSYGYLIEEGRIVRPVNQITIAGNFYDMLKNIAFTGNDVLFVMPDISYFGSPSLKISKLTVAGE